MKRLHVVEWQRPPASKIRTGAKGPIIVATITFLFAALMPIITQAAERSAFRVCADPHNLPFSDTAKEGYENEIAALMAKDLDLPIQYYWAPYQEGFDRITLKGWNKKEKRYNCDIVIGTTGLDVGTTTKPYYASTYVAVYRKGGKLGDLHSAQELAEEARKNRGTRIGVFDLGPGTAWLESNGLLPQLVPYRAQSGSRKVIPSRIVMDVAKGLIDAALVWGPIAGYYAQKIKTADLQLLPLKSPGVRFAYGISMGMRYGEPRWMHTITQLLRKDKGRIHEILAKYNVPLVPIPKQDLVPDY